MSNEVVEKVDELIKSSHAETTSAIEGSKKFTEETLAKATAEVEALKDELLTKVSTLESKIATIPSIAPVIRKGGGIRGEVHRRVSEEMRSYIKAGQQVEKEFKLFTDEAEYRAFMIETDARMSLMEASTLTGSGSGVGGRTSYDPVFFSWRLLNPLRRLARNVATDGSDYQFRVKTGNIGATWGYPVQANGLATTLSTNIFQLPLKDLNAYAAVRTAALDDIDGLEMNIVDDLYQEWSQSEAISMIVNNDQAGTGSTVPSGGADGVRGLDVYPGYNATYTGGTISTASYGTSGTGSTSGLHSLASYDQALTNGAGTTNNITFNDLVNFMHLLPQQYWDTQGGFSGSLAWMISPLGVAGIRGLVDNNKTPAFERMSPALYPGYIGMLLGIPVVVNGYMDSPISTGTTPGTVNKTPIYLANWDRFYTIVDRMSMTVRRFDQTIPGSIVFYGEKRLVSAVKDPFAGVRYRSTATAQA